MKSNQFFNFSRFVNVVKTDLLPKRRAILTAALGAMGVMLVFTFFGAYVDFRIENAMQKLFNFYNRLFPVVAFIAGLFITAATFRPLTDNRKAHRYMAIPASHFEKYLSKWLSTGPLYMIGAMLLIAITAVISKMLLAIYPGVSMDLGQVFSELKVSRVTGYLIPHAIFLLGSIAFKRLAFWKTLLAMFATLMAWAIFTGFSFRLLFAKFFTGNSMTIEGDSFNVDLPFLLEMSPETGWWIASIVSLLVWTTLNAAGYFKLKETEV